MKKKTSIAASLILLFLIIFSCEQEDQIGSFTSSDSEIGAKNKANDPLNILPDRRKRKENSTINVTIKGEENSNGCMDAYPFDKTNQGNSMCFFEDFKTWGWSNYIPVSEQHYKHTGKTYTYPVYASAFQCDIDNSMEVGLMTMHIAGAEGNLYADLSITISNSELMIKEFSLYAGIDAYPLDKNGAESIAFEDFDISLTDLNTNTYAVNNLDWGEASYFITHLKICPRQ